MPYLKWTIPAGWPHILSPSVSEGDSRFQLQQQDVQVSNLLDLYMISSCLAGGEIPRLKTGSA
ncbi:hypothetical protein ACLOJK_011186 [Asimina triloba]